MANATGTFTVTSMGEDTYREGKDGQKLTRANGTQQFGGDLEGDGSVEWLMCYLADGSARFAGHQRLEGSVEGRSGSFVVEAIGTFDGGRSIGDWTVIEGSGTGELAGITGRGGFEAPGGTEASYHLEYELP